MIIQSIRDQFPEYAGMNDEELMGAVHKEHYSDMPREEFDRCCGMRPIHDDLVAAAITGADSLDLQEMDPTVKPAVKMTVEELMQHMERTAGKVVVIWDDAAYVIDPLTLDPTEAMAAIFEGDDSAILGYPPRGRQDAAVTKQGEVVTDVDAMRQHADAGNLIWAASGDGEELKQKAQDVAAAITRALTPNQVG